MVHAHEMGPDASTKVTLNLDAISENVLAEVMDVFAFKFLGEVGIDINALQFLLLQAYGMCGGGEGDVCVGGMCVLWCVCVGVGMCVWGGGGGVMLGTCVSILEVLQFLVELQCFSFGSCPTRLVPRPHPLTRKNNQSDEPNRIS